MLGKLGETLEKRDGTKENGKIEETEKNQRINQIRTKRIRTKRTKRTKRIGINGIRENRSKLPVALTK